jgi:hypothetical protein
MAYPIAFNHTTCKIHLHLPQQSMSNTKEKPLRALLDWMVHAVEDHLHVSVGSQVKALFSNRNHASSKPSKGGHGTDANRQRLWMNRCESDTSRWSRAVLDLPKSREPSLGRSDVRWRQIYLSAFDGNISKGRHALDPYWKKKKVSSDGRLVRRRNGPFYYLE